MWRPLELATSVARDAVGVGAAFYEAFRADASKASPSTLLGEHARPSTAGLNTPHRRSVGDHLKPDRLAQILRDAVNGEASAYLTLAEEMEEREPHYRSVLGTRKLAVSGLPINVKSVSDSAHDRAIAEDVEDLLQRPEAEALVIDMMDGVAKGFANVEIIWERNVKRWEPVRYEWRQPQHFVWDRDTLATCNLRTAANAFEGEPLAPFKWIQHRPKLCSGIPLRTGIALPAALAYMAKRYTVADWLTFLDIFGMPVRVGKFPADMKSRKRELLQALASIGTDAAAVIPKEMEIDFIESKGNAGGPVFQGSAEYWDKQTSKVVLGQTMSTDDGASLAQSKTHERVRFDIRGADSRSVMGAIKRDLVIPFVQLNYGPQVKYPTPWQKTQEPEDTKALMENTRTFVDLGGKVQMSEVRDRLGYSEPDEGAELLQPGAKVIADAQPTPEADPAQKPGEKPIKPGTKPADGKSLNSQVRQLVELLARKPRADTDDVVDDIVDDDLTEWRPLLEGNVGEILERVQRAETFEEATGLVRQLAEDNGVVLDLGTFTDALARSTFKARGVGSATDRVDV